MMYWKDEVKVKSDWNYVQGIYNYIEDLIPEMRNTIKNIDKIDNLELKQLDILNINDVIFCIEEWSNMIGVNLTFSGFKEINSYSFNLPSIYEWEEFDQTNDTAKIRYYLSPFAEGNPQLALCELIILLVNVYVEFSNNFHLSEDYYSDDDNLFRPFLMYTAIYLGFGQLLLNRAHLIGVNPDDNRDIIYEYHVPLKMEFLIMMYVLVDNDPYSKYNDLSVDVRKNISKLKEFLGRVSH